MSFFVFCIKTQDFFQIDFVWIFPFKRQDQSNFIRLGWLKKLFNLVKTSTATKSFYKKGGDKNLLQRCCFVWLCYANLTNISSSQRTVSVLYETLISVPSAGTPSRSRLHISKSVPRSAMTSSLDILAVGTV